MRCRHCGFRIEKRRTEMGAPLWFDADDMGFCQRTIVTKEDGMAQIHEPELEKHQIQTV